MRGMIPPVCEAAATLPQEGGVLQPGYHGGMAHLRIPRPWEIPERLATPEAVFLDRRQLLAALGLGAVTVGVAGLPAQIAGAAPVAPRGDPAKMLLPAVGPRFH